MTDQHQPQSGIEIESSYFWLAFLLYFFPPTVVVNSHDPGKLAVLETYPSGSRPFAPVPPAWGAPVAQPATPTAGAIPVTPVATDAPSGSATDASPAGWHADPMGRHELRYWDGNAWTSHVSSHGTQSVDEEG